MIKRPGADAVDSRAVVKEKALSTDSPVLFTKDFLEYLARTRHTTSVAHSEGGCNVSKSELGVHKRSIAYWPDRRNVNVQPFAACMLLESRNHIQLPGSCIVSG